MPPGDNYSHLKQHAKDQGVEELSGGAAEFWLAVRGEEEQNSVFSVETSSVTPSA